MTLITWKEAGRLAGQHYGELGGHAAAANMTPEQRHERAKKAVAARKWRPPKKGNNAITHGPNAVAKSNSTEESNPAA